MIDQSIYSMIDSLIDPINKVLKHKTPKTDHVFYRHKNQDGSLFIHSFTHSGYFYSSSSSPLLLKCAPVYSVDTVSKLTCRSATGNCE